MVTGSALGSRSRDRAAPPRYSSPSAGGRHGGVAAAAVLAGLCALCYGNSLRGEFVHDDVWAIVNNPDVRAATPVAAVFANDFWGKRMAENTSHKSYRPLCVLTFKLNILLAGMNPFYFHAVNVILHCLVTLVLMYTCDKAVFKDCRLAFVTALFFAVHPIHTEAVSMKVKIFLSNLFFRSVDQLYVGEHFPPTASPFFLLLSLFLGTCAMLVKETGVTVFGVLTCCACCAFLMLAPAKMFHVLAVIPYITLPVFFCRFLTYSYLLAFNAWLLLAPITLCYDWQVGSIPLIESIWDARNLATVFLVCSMGNMGKYPMRYSLKLEHKEVLVGLLFLVFPFIPASNLFFRVGFVVAERVLYMPR
uniref:Transmembrane O-mannosyltransferase targeting cadherins 1 n=1 Tax=Amazona collaria TaxID=241587 RepID=A0A8B9GNA1_9PSIT